MATFTQKLDLLLEHATEQQLIKEDLAERLRQLAAEQERGRGILSLTAVLSWLGGSILGLGILLVIAANWNAIHHFFKLAGVLALFLGAHAAGFWLRRRARPLLAEGMMMLAGILCLCSIGLVSQIYHLDGRASLMFLFWLVAIAPLAWALRSASLAILSVFALLLTLHIEQAEWSIPLLSVVMMTEMSVALLLVGLAGYLRDREPLIAATFRGIGVLLIFGVLYVMGFYRHWGISNDWGLSAAQLLGVWWIAVTGALGGFGIWLGYRWLLPENTYLRDRLLILLTGMLGTLALMSLVELRVLPLGPDLKFFNFGWYRTFHFSEWLLSIVAWVLWFAAAMWCILFASRTGRKAYLNVGVLGVGLGVLTRFFDLFGSMFETGLAFVVGGTLLLGTCGIAEYYRRSILATLAHADEADQAREVTV